MSLRVVQWATGSVFMAAIKDVLEHRDLELAGCWVHSEANSGKDVGDIVGTPPLGVTATNTIDDVAIAAHCVNAVPATCAAPSVVQGFFDLPPITGRAAPGLSR